MAVKNEVKYVVGTVNVGYHMLGKRRKGPSLNWDWLGKAFAITMPADEGFPGVLMMMITFTGKCCEEELLLG